MPQSKWPYVKFAQMLALFQHATMTSARHNVHSSSYCQGHGDKRPVPASHDLFEWDCTSTPVLRGDLTVTQIRTRRTAPTVLVV